MGTLATITRGLMAKSWLKHSCDCLHFGANHKAAARQGLGQLPSNVVCSAYFSGPIVSRGSSLVTLLSMFPLPVPAVCHVIMSPCVMTSSGRHVPLEKPIFSWNSDTYLPFIPPTFRQYETRTFLWGHSLYTYR